METTENQQRAANETLELMLTGFVRRVAGHVGVKEEIRGRSDIPGLLNSWVVDEGDLVELAYRTVGDGPAAEIVDGMGWWGRAPLASVVERLAGNYWTNDSPDLFCSAVVVEWLLTEAGHEWETTECV